MQTMKKLFALLLALAMVMSFAVPAMAAEDEVQTFTITIEGSKSNTVEGSEDAHIYEAYQVLKGSLHEETKKDSQGNDVIVSTLADIQWSNEGFGTTLLGMLKTNTAFGATEAANLFSSVETAAQFAEVISKPTFTTAQLETVAHVINTAVKTSGMLPVATTEGQTTAPYTLSVTPGYYMIKDKDGTLEGTHKDYTDIILHVAQNVTVYHKGSVPTVEKEVSEANSSYGKAIEMAMQKEYYYKLVGTLPSDFDNFTAYEYTFVDSMGAGIDFVGIHQVFAVYTNSGTEEPLTGYTLTEPSAENGNKLTIHFEDLKHDNKHPFQSGDKIVVIYKAKLNENAIVGGTGNPNTVYLEYSNNPNGSGTGKTTTTGTKVYTFDFHLDKIDGDTSDTLEGVEFVLYREVPKQNTAAEGGAESQAGNTVPEYAVVVNGKITAWEEGIYYDDPDEIPSKYILKTSTVNADGETVYSPINVAGLDTGVKYFLQEVRALGGYNKIVDPIPMLLTSTKEGDTVTLVGMTSNASANITGNHTMEVDGKTVVVGISFDVPNYTGDVLPSTGGIGTTLFYIIGSVLVLGAIVLLVTKKRMS